MFLKSKKEPKRALRRLSRHTELYEDELVPHQEGAEIALRQDVNIIVLLLSKDAGNQRAQGAQQQHANAHIDGC